jgi:hypothetical protein
VEFLVFMRSSSGARFYVTCAKGPAELGRRLPTCPGPRPERRGFSLGPLSTSSAAVRAGSGDVAIAQTAVIRRQRGAWVKGPKTVNHPHQVGLGELLSYGFDQASG